MKILFRLSILGIFISFLACQSESGNSNTETNNGTTAEASADGDATNPADTAKHKKFNILTGPNADKPAKPAKTLDADVPLTPSSSTAHQEYTCMGNEPNWNLQIKTNGIVWFRMGEPKINFPYRKPVNNGDYITIESENQFNKISITISKEHCQDSMADLVHPFTSSVTIDGKSYQGCAK